MGTKMTEDVRGFFGNLRVLLFIWTGFITETVCGKTYGNVFGRSSYNAARWRSVLPEKVSKTNRFFVGASRELILQTVENQSIPEEYEMVSCSQMRAQYFRARLSR